MAKYTMLFNDWLKNGGELPAVFSQMETFIEGFSELFIARFFDREIGFETPELFGIKFNEKASIIIPNYVTIMNNSRTAFNRVGNPQREQNREYTSGKKDSELTVLPINSLTATPNQKTSSAEFVDKDVTRFSGTSPDEAIRIADFYLDLTNKKWIMTEKCLAEFNDLFMRVY